MPPHHDHHHHHHHEEMVAYDDYEFDELPPHLQAAAKTLGWDAKLWDEDGKADTEDLDWDELTHEQRKAAEQFGYHPKLWDEGHGHRHKPPPHHDHDHHHDHHHHHHHHDDHQKKDDEKKEGEDTPDVSNMNINDGDGKDSSSDGKQNESSQKKQFKMSKSYGGEGGEPFNHGNNPHISKIVVHADSHVVHGLEVTYNAAIKKAGRTGGDENTITLERGEVITMVTVRSNKYVQSLAFKTNKGNEFGPFGGKGWRKVDLRGNDTEGDEVKVHAPIKYQLCGFTGQSGKYIDKIAFRWGPVPESN